MIEPINVSIGVAVSTATELGLSVVRLYDYRKHEQLYIRALLTDSLEGEYLVCDFDVQDWDYPDRSEMDSTADRNEADAWFNREVGLTNTTKD